MNAFNTIYEVFWVWKDAALPAGFDPQRQRVMTLDGVGRHSRIHGANGGVP